MTEEKIELPEQNYGPGNVLRAKREEYEWSVEAVAEALHLSTHSVKAIEADRYDELPGATYVIGYWRSYARLLGIDIEETIEVNKRNLNIVTSESAGLDVNRAFKRRKKSGGTGWLLTLLILAGLGYYAWTNNFWGLLNGTGTVQPGVTTETDEAVTTQPEAENSQPQVLMPLESKTEADVEPSDAAPPADTPPEESAEQPASGLVLQGGDSMQQGSAPAANAQSGLVMSSGLNQPDTATGAQSSPNLLSAQTEQSDAGQTEQAVVTGEQPKAADEPVTEVAVTDKATVTTADDPSMMVLTLSKDSWLDIRDKTNTRLLYKTESAGKTISITGTPPFYVYIGTPDGVRIQYQGKDVPFETHKSGLFARFKLGDETLESL